jgi:hypothetical protein
MKITATILLTCLSATSFAQSAFEGEIIYHNKFISKIPNVTGEQIGMMIGTTQEYFIKDASYKSRINGSIMVLQLYDPKTNRLYNKKPASDTLYWIDAASSSGDVVNYEIFKNKEKVLGLDCDALVVYTKNDTTTLYYSPKYKAEASLYAKHNYGNWFFFLSKSGALPLKTVFRSRQFIMESVAVEVKPMQLTNNYFAIPPGAPLKKSE